MIKSKETIKLKSSPKHRKGIPRLPALGGSLGMTTTDMFSLIAAVADNNCIGNKNKIPWNIPEDFQYFKKTTLGKTCLMGTATFKSIMDYLGKPLPGRKTVVLSRDPNFIAPEGVRVYNDISKALEELKDEDVFICGGASIYKQTINRVDTLYITHVHQTPDGDTFFPTIEAGVWKKTSEEKHGGFSFVTYRRVIPTESAHGG